MRHKVLEEPQPLNVGIDTCLKDAGTVDLRTANQELSAAVNRGIVPISHELLIQALALPSGTKIVNARLSDSGQCVELVVDHDSLPKVSCGYPIPQLSVSFQTFDGKIVSSEYWM